MAAPTPVSQPPFGIHSDISSKIVSFLDYPDLLVFFRVSQGAYALRDKNKGQLERDIFSRIHIFDRAHWKEYYGLGITDKYDPCKIDVLVLRKFLKSYYGPNPIGPGRVKDACLIPTVEPRVVKRTDKKFEYSGNRLYNLKLLGKLAEHPKKGHAAKYSHPTIALEKHGKTGPVEERLILLLKGVVARKKPWSKESPKPSRRGQVQFLQELNDKTGYGCETEPDLSQNTVLFAHHTVTGELPFGDDTGMEGEWTYGCTREFVTFRTDFHNVVSGGFRKDGSTPAVLEVSLLGPFEREDCGVAVMKKF